MLLCCHCSVILRSLVGINITILNRVPRRIAKDAIEAAFVEDLGEGEVPVEEAVLGGELGDFFIEVVWQALTLDEVAEGAGGDAGNSSLFLVLCSWLGFAGGFGGWGGGGLAEEVGGMLGFGGISGTGLTGLTGMSGWCGRSGR